MRPEDEKELYRHPPPLQQFPDLLHFCREHYKGVIIGNQGYDPDSAEKDVSSKLVDLVSFAKLYIVNPDLFERIANSWPIETKQDIKTWMSGSAEGYTSYPAYASTK